MELQAQPAKEKPSSRACLMSAAERLFSEKGYAAVSTREIADTAGVNLGAIQYYFGSKAQLFTAVIHEVMRRRREGPVASTLSTEPHSREEAAERLCRFIAALLEEVSGPAGNEMCRILFREVLSEMSLDPQLREVIVAAAVDDFMRPTSEQLAALLRRLDPALSAEEISLAAHSIAGQCVFYFTHEQFLERLHGKRYLDDAHRAVVGRYVSRFTLRALDCPREAADKSIAAVFGPDIEKDNG